MANEPIIGSVMNADQEVLEKCKQEIDAALQKYGCAFEVGLLLRPGHFPDPIMKIVMKQELIVPNMGFPQNLGGMMPSGKA